MSIEIKFLLMFFAILANDFMDAINFCRPRNSGWWSINSLKFSIKFLGWKWDFDGWHTFKKIMWLAAGLAVFGFTWYFLLFACMNFAQHNLTYHKLLKPIFKR